MNLLKNIKKILTYFHACVKPQKNVLKYETNLDDNDDLKFDSDVELENKEIADLKTNHIKNDSLNHSEDFHTQYQK